MSPDLGPLFSGLPRVREAHERMRSAHAAKIDLLAPRLRDLALARGAYGVDAGDTRRLGVTAGVITGGEQKRELSWLAVVPRRAGLVSAGLRAEWNEAGNRHTKYLHPACVIREGAA